MVFLSENVSEEELGLKSKDFVFIGALELSGLGVSGKFDLVSDLLSIDVKVEEFFFLNV